MTVEDEEGYEIAEQYLIKKYGDDYVDFIETEGQSYLDGLEKGLSEGKPKWIYCNESMPVDNQQVLVAYKSKRGFNVCRATYHECVKNWRNVDTATFLAISFKVYAWTKLLESPPYKE